VKLILDRNDTNLSIFFSANWQNGTLFLLFLFLFLVSGCRLDTDWMDFDNYVM